MAIRVLISGAGIAGPVAAYFLRRSKTPMIITVIERAPFTRASGHNIDIRDRAIDIIREMGIEPAIREKHTSEEGFMVINSEGKTLGKFPADEGSSSFTAEYEILRTDLADILHDASLKNDEDVNKQSSVDYIYSESISSITQQDQSMQSDKVQIKFKSGKSASFDLVILADGLFSSTRELVFGKEIRPGRNNSTSEHEAPLRDVIKSLKQYWALFSMPQVPGVTDQDRYARWCTETRGRLMFTRPTPTEALHVLLGITRNDLRELDQLMLKRDPDELKAFFRREFADAGWISKELLEGMDKSDTFYCQLTAQLKTDELVKGRVALLGDAGYCPSPISGRGTSIAIIGAETIGRCLSGIESSRDIPLALQDYQRKILPEARRTQKLFPGAPWIIQPQSWLGVYVVRSCVWIVAVIGDVRKAVGSYFSSQSSVKPASAVEKVDS